MSGSGPVSNANNLWAFIAIYLPVNGNCRGDLYPTELLAD